MKLITIDGTRKEIRMLGARCLVHLDNFSANAEYQLAFSNTGDSNVEGVFTFAIGSHIQFQNLKVRFAGHDWQKGEIKGRQEAEEEYEDLTERGRTAIQAKRNNNDLVTLNIGTLKPGEAIDVQLSLAVLLDIDAGIASLRIPTAIVPRYGDPTADGLTPEEEPKTDVYEEQPFDVRVLFGSGFRGSSIVECTYDLHDANIDGSDDDWLEEPFEEGRTHGWVEIFTDDGKAMVSEQEVQWNQAFGFHVKGTTNSWVSLVPNPVTNGSIAYLNFYLEGEAQKQTPRVHVLLDCSGSMSDGGERIVEECLHDLVRKLPEDAAIGLSRFGSDYEEVLPFGEGKLDEFRQSIDSASTANMGGTDLGNALQQLLDGLADKSADILPFCF